jgi:predicted transcriptional regulator
MNALPATADTLGLAALQLFREGRDTADIAEMLGVTEARASQLIWLARCRAKHLPAELLTPSGAVRRLQP